MAARKAASKGAAVAPTLLLCRGQFITVSVESVQVHLLGETGIAALYDGLQVAEGTRDPEGNARLVLADVFRHAGILLALPAGSAEAVTFIAERYDGPQSERVRGIAACILTGTPYGPDETRGPEGGTRDRMPVRPPLPIAPAPAMSVQS